jgi:aminoglycoside 6'-N-acetyltransferase
VAIRVRGRLTALRPATEADVELLVRWHADPEVARFWDGKTYTSDEMRRRLARADVEAFIVEAAGEPVGYLQAWRSGDEGGLDMFLVPEARGHGLGPDAARAMAEHLVGERRWPRLIVDPYVSNQAAIHAWRRAGFEAVEERPADADHSGPWLLMEFGTP